MTGQVSIFKDVEGRDLLVNLTDDFQFLRTPSIESIMDALVRRQPKKGVGKRSQD